jgi:hypothetical protein
LVLKSSRTTAGQRPKMLHAFKGRAPVRFPSAIRCAFQAAI